MPSMDCRYALWLDWVQHLFLKFAWSSLAFQIFQDTEPNFFLWLLIKKNELWSCDLPPCGISHTSSSLPGGIEKGDRASDTQIMGSNLKVSGWLRWRISALPPRAAATTRGRARWQAGGERMSAIEGLIDTRDVTIVIELSQMLSNPLPHLSSTMAVRFSAIICSEKDFVPSGTQVTKLKSKRLTFEGKKRTNHSCLKRRSVCASCSDWWMWDWVEHTERHLLISRFNKGGRHQDPGRVYHRVHLTLFKSSQFNSCFFSTGVSSCLSFKLVATHGGKSRWTRQWGGQVSRSQRPPTWVLATHSADLTWAKTSYLTLMIVWSDLS